MTELTIAVNGTIVYRQKTYIARYRDAIDTIPGVYLVRDKETDDLLYIGTAHNLHDRLYWQHHVYDPKQHSVEIVPIEEGPTRIWLETILVSSLHPKENQRVAIRLGDCGGKLP